MAVDIELRNLKALLKELSKIRGRHTELVTVYIPAGFNINTVSDQLRGEKSTAENIKSKSTKKNVQAALDKVIGHLKGFKETPPNGIAIFCGNVAKDEGVADISIWSIQPPRPVGVRLYRCDQVFILEPLEELFAEKDIYGFILIDRADADIGILRGKRIEIVKHFDSLVPGKTAKGGWSANRYARVREGLFNDFLKEVGDVANEKFRGMLKDLKGIVLGGPGMTKDDFYKGDFLQTEIKNKVLGTVDTSYTGENGFNEALLKSEDLLKEASIIREKQVLEKFFSELGKDSGLTVYGLKETMEALSSGNLQILLISEELDLLKIIFRCNCGETVEKIIDRSLILDQKCPKCGNVKLQILSEEDLIPKIVQKSEEMKTEMEMISTQTIQGEQLKGLGGLAGILRYRVKY